MEKVVIWNMVDSRQKGARAELAARDILRKYTGHTWERVPASGALSASHKLKGDLYIPEVPNIYCVEVKHYKTDHLTSKILTSKDPQIFLWWKQAEREAKQIDKEPLLLFKFDRSKWFVATKKECKEDYIFVKTNELYIMLLELWLQKEKVRFVHG